MKPEICETLITLATVSDFLAVKRSYLNTASPDSHTSQGFALSKRFYGFIVEGFFLPFIEVTGIVEVVEAVIKTVIA